MMLSIHGGCAQIQTLHAENEPAFFLRRQIRGVAWLAGAAASQTVGLERFPELLNPQPVAVRQGQISTT